MAEFTRYFVAIGLVFALLGCGPKESVQEPGAVTAEVVSPAQEEAEPSEAGADSTKVPPTEPSGPDTPVLEQVSSAETTAPAPVVKLSGSQCSDRSKRALDALRAIEDEAPSCAQDSDCVTFVRSTDCMGSCPRAVHASLLSRLEDKKAELNATVCKEFKESGCPRAAPRCMPMMSGKCINAKCELAPAKKSSGGR